MPLKTISDKLVKSEELVALTYKVVGRYAHVIPKAEVEDVVMHIVEQFLQQETRIVSNFNNKSKPSTYCFAVLNRMCCGIIRKELPSWKRYSGEEINEAGCCTSVTDTSHAFIIQDEVNYLKKIFILLNDKNKFIVFVAYYFSLECRKDYLVDYVSQEMLESVLQMLSPVGRESKGEIFKTLSEVVNLVESKAVKPDAVRMWLNKEQLNVISKLNGKWGRASYDKETFQTLFEHFYKSK